MGQVLSKLSKNEKNSDTLLYQIYLSRFHNNPGDCNLGVRQPTRC